MRGRTDSIKINERPLDAVPLARVSGWSFIDLDEPRIVLTQRVERILKRLKEDILLYEGVPNREQIEERFEAAIKEIKDARNR